MTYVFEQFKPLINNTPLLAYFRTDQVPLFLFFIFLCQTVAVGLFLVYYFLLYRYKAYKSVKLNFFYVFMLFFCFTNFFSLWLFLGDDFETVYIVICIVLFIIADLMQYIRYDTCHTVLWNILANKLNFISEVNYEVDKAFSGIIKSLLAISGIFLADICVYHMNQTTVELFGFIPMSDVYSIISVFLCVFLSYYTLSLIVFMLLILIWTIKSYYNFRKDID